MRTYKLKFFSGQNMGEIELQVSDFHNLAQMLGFGVNINGITFWEWEVLSIERVA